MSRYNVVALFSLVALVGCEHAPPPATVPSSNADGFWTDREDDPFYANSYSWGSQSSDAHTNDGSVDVKPRRLDQSPENTNIKRFVESLASIGIRLGYDAERLEWQTTEPIVGSYAIRFTIGAFPSDSTLREMQMSLMAINLAFGLNPDAHLAMSNPNLVGLTTSETNLFELEEALKSETFQAAQDKLKRAFLNYRR